MDNADNAQPLLLISLTFRQIFARHNIQYLSYLTSSRAGRLCHGVPLHKLDRRHAGPHELLCGRGKRRRAHDHEGDPTSKNHCQLVEDQPVQDRRVIAPLIPPLLVVEAKLKDLLEAWTLLVYSSRQVFVDSVQDQGNGAHDCWS